MGAHQGALVAADAVFRDPLRHVRGNAALFVFGSLHGGHTVGVRHEYGHRQGIARLIVHGDLNLPDVLGQGLVHNGLFVLELLPRGGDFDLHDGIHALVHSGAVHVHDLLALLGIAFHDGVLHIAHSLFNGHNAGQLEEGGLQHGVRSVAQTQLRGDFRRVDGVELDAAFRNDALDLIGQVLLQFRTLPAGVQQERAAGLDFGHDIVCFNVRFLVAGHEIRHGDKVCAADGLMAEAQMALGHAAGLLGVVFKIRLGVLVGVVTDDFDGILVGADSAVRAQPPELAGDDGLSGGDDVLAQRQGSEGHIVVDAHGEVVLLAGLHVVEHGLHLGGSSVLGGQAVAARQQLDLTGQLALGDGGADILVQRLAQGAGLLGAVQHGNGLSRGGNGLQEVLQAEGTVQVHLDHAHLLATLHQMVHNLHKRLAHAAHGDDYAGSLGMAVVVEQLILLAGDLVHLLHIILHDLRQSVICGVARLPGLEEGVGILQSGADGGVLSAQSVVFELLHRVPIQHGAQVLVVQHLDLLQLVGGAEAVKEMLEGDTALNGGQVGHRRQVHTFLHATRAKLGKTSLAAGHHVGMVTENGHGVGSHGPGGHVHHAGEHGARHAVHGGDHQQQALGRGIGAGEGPGLQCAVHGAGGTGFCLEFHQLYRLAEQVFLAVCRPLVHMVRHGAGRRDGVNRRYLRKCVGHVGGGFIAVHRLKDFFLFRHSSSSISFSTVVCR